jgi:hypothetical protein
MGEHPMRIDWAQLKAQRSLLKQAEEANESAAKVEQARKVFERFFEPNQKSIFDYVAKSRDIEDEIYRTNRPEPRKYELSPVAGGAK